MKFKHSWCYGVAVALLGVGAAHSTSFTYTGNTLTSIGEQSLGMSLDLVLVTNEPIAMDFTGSLTSSDFSSVTATAVGGDPSSLQADVSNIVSFELVQGQVSYAFIYSPFLFSTVNNYIESYDPSGTSYDQIESFNNFESMVNSNSLDPGTWVVTGETSAAPEPGVWTMMIVGAAGVGATLRRRRTWTAQGV